MDRTEIIRLAKLAATKVVDYDLIGNPITDADVVMLGAYGPFIERFAQLVAAAERERCAKVCEQSEITFDIQVWMDSTKKQMTALVAMALAAAIRARGDSK